MEIKLNIPERHVSRFLDFLAGLAREDRPAALRLRPPVSRPHGAAAAPGLNPAHAARVFFRIAAGRTGLDAEAASGADVAEALDGLAREGRYGWLKVFPNGDLLITCGVIGEMARTLPPSLAPRNLRALARTMEGKGKYDAYRLRWDSIRGIRIPAYALAEWLEEGPCAASC